MPTPSLAPLPVKVLWSTTSVPRLRMAPPLAAVLLVNVPPVTLQGPAPVATKTAPPLLALLPLNETVFRLAVPPRYRPPPCAPPRLLFTFTLVIVSALPDMVEIAPPPFPD